MTDPTPAALIAERNTWRISAVLCVVSCAFVLLFLIAAALRASYPLQLEWLEGGVLDAVHRVIQHEPVYVRPTHLWVPFVYMPLYYYVGALASRIGGSGFEPLRLLSTSCTVGCFLLQGAMAARMARSRAAGVIAAGFFAALYATTGAWYDLARVDMLFTVLTLGDCIFRGAVVRCGRRGCLPSRFAPNRQRWFSAFVCCCTNIGVGDFSCAVWARLPAC